MLKQLELERTDLEEHNVSKVLCLDFNLKLEGLVNGNF